MKIYDSCQDTIHECERGSSFAIGHLYHDDKPMAMHIHDSYELYYSISGGRQFLIDNRFYDINPGDIFFINQYESHHVTQVDHLTHERILISIDPEYIKKLSTKNTNLNYCFSERSEHQGHKLSLTAEEQKRFMYFIHRFSSIDGFGSDIMTEITFLELMIFLNKTFLDHASTSEELTTTAYTEETHTSMNVSQRQHTQVDDILSFINQNINNDITIKTLSDHFYLSSSYLCRIFKSTTGTTINKYITAKRISIAKSLLSEGHPVNEVCRMAGFNDYSNFLKAFTKAVGISPKKYAQFTS